MVRISDGRMSGTGFGTVILHAAPEATEGGNFSIVQSGDIIELNIPDRQLNLKVSAQELENRKRQWRRPAPLNDRGYASLYISRVEQANLGTDFDFLKGMSGSKVTRDSH